jgi:type II secretory pathway predicted ATPase ExeA
VLILDEAHLLDIDQLEELRLLTNADMDTPSVRDRDREHRPVAA